MTVQISQDDPLKELEQTQKLCQALMKTPHYAKMGEVGIYAIVNKAKSMGVNPLDALNGSFYFVQGKVEMSGQSMLALIRSKGHSVSMDPKSTDQKVIMYGKRCDNGDAWRAEFGIEDAKKQGIFRNQWEKMPRVMCMWRCVSQLGRFLFSDVLKGVYVQGEISDAVAFDAPVNYIPTEVEEIKVEPMTCGKEKGDELSKTLTECSPEYQNTVQNFLKRAAIESFDRIPMDAYLRLNDRALSEKNAYAPILKELEALKAQTNEVTDA